MSFSASARRALDDRQPLGLRVACLHECLEQFNLFGYTLTRERLRIIVGADAPGWSSAQVVSALALLQHAKTSWARFADDERARQRERKRVDRTRGASWDGLFLAWCKDYLQGERAGTWLVAGFGACEACGHDFIYHRGWRGCLACGADRRIEWTARCVCPPPAPEAWA